MALKHLLVLLVSAPLAFSQGGGLPAKESFSYNIEWRLFNAGKAKVDVTSSTEPKAEYQIKLHLESTGFVSKLFKVNDDYTAVLGSTLCAESAHMITHESSRQRET